MLQRVVEIQQFKKIIFHPKMKNIHNRLTDRKKGRKKKRTKREAEGKKKQGMVLLRIISIHHDNGVCS
jgi:hypothetical protein